ncbi:hypothetical protein C482_16968 [Natrialba chahannaoensis JCM 10990]|uniref:Helix-hairpin-helix domain-containing protein n=1 Tax=Natrialba chahannaoensis JCM 10990 TaxID=1227492 RepID=M0ADC0_9EURY|nr:hypothetical protein C482_16968 [Natrialba chahannaoensis JCM 10990]
MSNEQFVAESNEAGSANEWDGETGGQTDCDHEERPPAVRKAIEERAGESDSDSDFGDAVDETVEADEISEPSESAEDDTSETISLGIGLGIELPVIDEPNEVFVVDSTNRSSIDRESNSRLDDDQREQLAAADIDPDAVTNKEYSYQQLLDTEIDEAFADELRRRLSLPWSFQTDSDLGLDRRSDEVRGLGAAERAWIAASGTEDWQRFESQEPAGRAGNSSTDAKSDPDTDTADGNDIGGGNAGDERPYPRPTPVTDVTGVGPDDAAVLAEAGVTSAERLATVRAVTVARLLELDVLHVRSWRHNARELLSS